MTDKQRANVLMKKIQEAIPSNFLEELRQVVSRNRNHSTGDKSFTEETWIKAHDFCAASQYVLLEKL